MAFAQLCRGVRVREAGGGPLVEVPGHRVVTGARLQAQPLVVREDVGRMMWILFFFFLELHIHSYSCNVLRW